MQRILLGVLASLTFLLSIPLTAKQALAIPAFARKYNLPCSVCHVPAFPKLNDFGNLFRDRGYQLGGETDLPTSETLTNGYWPVAIRTTVGYQTSSLNKVGDGTPGDPTSNIATGDFGFTGLDILSFGTLARDISFGVVLTPGLGSAGFGSGSTETDSDLEAAYIKIDNLLQSDYLLNLKVGKFELDLPFSEKRSPTLDTPFVMYHYVAGNPYTTALGNPGLIPAPCCPAQTYPNANDFGIGDNHPGLEVSGFKKTPGDGYLRYSLNALSNSDVNAGNTGGGRKLNFYGHVTQSIGGYGIVSGQRVGVFGAYGDAPTAPNPVCAASPSAPSGCGAIAKDGASFYRAGVDVSLTAFNQVNLFGALMHAKDSQKLFSSQGIAGAQDAGWNGSFIEMDYNPIQLPTWLFSYRYDVIRNTNQGDPTFASDFNDVNSHTFLARYNFNISARVDTTFHVEYNYFRTKKTDPTGGDQVGQTTLVAFDFAF
ncbi:MAG: hypothetical protein HY203_10445 [Nitrospirae bacterium]|nr:hypothetical protein [Nitrospirota bacterium]